jgi:hypothetical protein
MSFTVRPALREDIDAFSDLRNKPTVRAWVGELDGQLIAMAGFAHQGGRWVAFCDLTEAARPHKMTIMRTAKKIMGEAKSMGIRYLYAEASPDEPGAVRWMASLGFKLDPRSAYLYRWES